MPTTDATMPISRRGNSNVDAQKRSSTGRKRSRKGVSNANLVVVFIPSSQIARFVGDDIRKSILVVEPKQQR